MNFSIKLKQIPTILLSKNFLAWLIIIIVAYALGTSAANFFSPSPMPKVYTFAQTGNNLNPNNPLQIASVDSYGVIQARNLFAAASHQPPPPTQAVGTDPNAPPPPPPPTTVGPLNARLVGTVDIDNPELSRAILIIDGQQRIIKIGDNVTSYIVKSIKRNEVIFDLNGQEVKLEQKLIR